MSDFFQTGSIATLHRLGKDTLPRLEEELLEFSQETKIALVLPCHVQELGTPALRNMLQELREVKYLEQIVVGIDGAGATDWERAKRLFSRMPQEVILLWNDGPRMKKLFAELRDADLGTGEPGKGRNLWMCFGAVLAGARSQMIAAHDCDILTYEREMLARLCYPVAHPNLGFDFCKGYSARYTTKLHGRVMRLMFTPLIRSLESMLGPHPLLVYLDTFRYPLSGEVSFDLDIARRTRMPSDWGVEVGMLAEVFRVASAKGICQSDLAERYDHRHQELSARDSQKGLHKMAIDIAKCIFRTLASEGLKLDAGFFDTLLSAYLRKAEDTARCYAADAAINGLQHDRHEEESAVATFVRALRTAGKSYLEDPLDSTFIPSWNRVEAALPEFLGKLNRVIAQDHE